MNILQLMVIIIIIMLPNQAIASTPSAPRPSGAEGTTDGGTQQHK
jgi:hypothetical protein